MARPTQTPRLAALRRSLVRALRVLAVVVFGLSVCPTAAVLFAAPASLEFDADVEPDAADLKELAAAPRARCAAPAQASRVLPTARPVLSETRAPHVVDWLLEPQRKTLLRLLV